MDNTAMIQMRDAELDLTTWSSTVRRRQEKTICISGIEVGFLRSEIKLSVELANSTNTKISLKTASPRSSVWGGGREAEEAEGEEGIGSVGSMGVGEQREQGKQAHVASFYSVGRKGKDDRH